MNVKIYDDLDLSRPLTPSWKAWLLRMQHMFQLLQEPPDTDYAVIRWRDGSSQLLPRKHALAFSAGIVIEVGGPPNRERGGKADAEVIDHIAQGCFWMRDLNAGRSPAARYVTRK